MYVPAAGILAIMGAYERGGGQCSGNIDHSVDGGSGRGDCSIVAVSRLLQRTWYWNLVRAGKSCMRIGI